MRVDLENPDPQAVAEAVTQLLVGSNKAAIARDVGISRELVYRWERGDSMPSIAELHRIAVLTGHEVVIKLNSQEPSVEEQIADLRREVEALHGRGPILAELFERLGKIEDPDAKELIRRLRQIGLGS